MDAENVHVKTRLQAVRIHVETVLLQVEDATIGAVVLAVDVVHAVRHLTHCAMGKMFQIQEIAQLIIRFSIAPALHLCLQHVNKQWVILQIQTLSVPLQMPMLSKLNVLQLLNYCVAR